MSGASDGGARRPGMDCRRIKSELRSDLSAEELRSREDVVRWRYSNGKIVVASKWKIFLEEPGPGQSRPDPEQHVSSATFAAGDKSELRWQFQGTLVRERRLTSLGLTLRFLELGNMRYRYEAALLDRALGKALSFCSDTNVMDVLGSESHLRFPDLEEARLLQEDSSLLLTLGILAESRLGAPEGAVGGALARGYGRFQDSGTPPELRDLEELFEEGLFSDVSVMVGSKRIPAHKNILAARSPRLRAMFLEEDDDADPIIKIEVRDVSYEVMRSLLRFMYTGQVRDEGEEPLKELMLAAHQFEVRAIFPRCEAILCHKYLKQHNAIAYLRLAELCRAERIENAAVAIVVDNVKRFSEADLGTLKAPLVTRILMAVSKRAGPSLQQHQLQPQQPALHE